MKYQMVNNNGRHKCLTRNSINLLQFINQFFSK